MPWLKLTDTNSEPIWVNIYRFTEMRKFADSDDPHTTLYAPGGASAEGVACKYQLAVRETPEQILRMADPKL